MTHPDHTKPASTGTAGGSLLVVALPCYNEEQALPGLLAELDAAAAGLPPGWRLRVLVVDDGSRDSTACVAQEHAARLDLLLERHAANLGLGAALATAVRCFLDLSRDAPRAALAVMDADGTHPPRLLKPMLARLDAPDAADVVIASRYAPGGEEHGLTPLRRLYSFLASAVLRLLARVRGARDYTCGYRLYRREILARAAERHGEALITERSFVCMAELLVKLGRCGARVAEVPLKLHYELKAGASKMNVPATIRRYAVLAWRLLFDPRFR